MWLIKTIDNAYLQAYATEATLFLPPTENNQLWTIIKERAIDKTSISQVTIDLRNKKGKLISHAACKRNDETFFIINGIEFRYKKSLPIKSLN